MNIVEKAIKEYKDAEREYAKQQRDSIREFYLDAIPELANILEMNEEDFIVALDVQHNYAIFIDNTDDDISFYVKLRFGQPCFYTMLQCPECGRLFPSSLFTTLEYLGDILANNKFENYHHCKSNSPQTTEAKLIETLIELIRKN